MPYTLRTRVTVAHRVQHTGSGGQAFVGHGVVVGWPECVKSPLESTFTTHYLPLRVLLLLLC